MAFSSDIEQTNEFLMILFCILQIVRIFDTVVELGYPTVATERKEFYFNVVQVPELVKSNELDI